MLILDYILLFVIVIILSMLLQRYYEKKERLETKDRYISIRNYLLNETSLGKNKKPLLWIHIPYEYNSRNWLDFNSRKSLELNQPYLYLTVQSIIEKCDDDFNICLIDDAAFSKIIPNWEINMKLISDPILTYMRQLAMVKLIHIYGGMIVPISFACFKNLDEMYKKGTRNDKVFLCETINDNITSTSYNVYPNIQFMGANKNNAMIEELINFMERTVSKDNTDQLNFAGEFNRWCNTRVYNNKINLIDGKEIGIKNMDDEIILVDNLLNSDYVSFYENMFGILIPSKMILKRKKYEWFARLSAEQVLQSDTILSKHILVSLGKNSTLTTNKLTEKEEKPNWINFWSVPSDAPVWGFQPNGLGDKLRSITV
jgi:hypothetical protein